MTTTDIPAHVYARIAEAVTKKTGIETDSIEVNAMIHDEWDNPTSPCMGSRFRILYAAALEEAREYGIEVEPYM